MTTAEETELLTRVGPGTPMGNLMRQYWIPACLSEQLSEPDCAPVRVRLLGEDLVAFRLGDGTLGLLDEHCPHRGASLALARTEDCGLRCIYHGWKIDAMGHVLETPNEPERSPLRNRFTHTAYPVVEDGGIIWTCMSKADPPPFRRFGWCLAAPESLSLVHVRQQCNWLQSMEGVLDTAHSNQLHSDFIRGDASSSVIGGASRRTTGSFSRPSDDARPVLRVLDTPYGFRYAGIRKTITDPDKYKYVRTTVFVAPFFTFLSSTEGIADMQAYVPIDDEQTAFYYAHYSFDGPIDDAAWRAWIGTTKNADLDDEYRPVRNRANNWLQDRDAMRRGESFSGVSGVLNQDFAVQESMGPIYDRSREHLGASDLAILHMRRRLLEAIRQHAAGESPMGLNCPEVNYEKIRAKDSVIPIDLPWETVGADTDGL